jgi:hypothetical protein
MIYYVAHAYGGNKENVKKAREITHDLQVKDLANCYICPLLAFSHLEYGEIGYDDEIELCLDILQNCDRLIIASEITKGVQTEIDFANLLKMEVVRLNEFGEIQPFSE